MLLQKKETNGKTKALYKSSNILASTYSPVSNILEIIFTNGTKYAYKDVRATDYMRFETADSQGKVLNTNIKGKYEFDKLEDETNLTKIKDAATKADTDGEASLFRECAARLTSGLTKFEGKYDLKFVLTVRKLAQQTLDAVGYEEPSE